MLWTISMQEVKDNKQFFLRGHSCVNFTGNFQGRFKNFNQIFKFSFVNPKVSLNSFESTTSCGSS